MAVRQTTSWCRWKGDTLELHIQVRTQCRHEGLEGKQGNAVRVRVNAPPVEGKANGRVTAVVAQAFGVPKSRVELVHGLHSRRKLIRIHRPVRVPKQLESALPPMPRVDQT